MATRVSIRYGIFGGPKIGKKFIRALQSHGYEHVRDEKDADIIIAHSAGCFGIPRHTTQGLLCIDPVYWPEKTIRERIKIRRKSHMQYKRNGFPLRYFLNRTLWAIFYAVFDVRRNVLIMRQATMFHLPDIIKDRRAVIARNTNDDWLTPDFKKLEQFGPRIKTIAIPAPDHDDCWFNPEPYIKALALLKKN